jgi:2,4-dienoyl-CoA reductase-like NADH-dependent reductase (Old Yellow Enzyme family)
LFLKEGAAIASEIDAKVILTGGIRNEEQMSSILNETKIEYIGLARPLIKDPAFVKKFRQKTEAKPNAHITKNLGL